MAEKWSLVPLLQRPSRVRQRLRRLPKSAAVKAGAGDKLAKVKDAMTVGELQDKFKADAKAMLDTKVKVKGVYISTTTSGSNINVSVIEKKGQMRPSTSCAVSEAPKLKQYDAVVIEGTVKKSFGAALKDCTVTKL